MKYLLDTNTCIAYLRTAPPPILEALRRIPSRHPNVSSITVAELWHGAHKSNRFEHNARLLRRLFAAIRPLPFDVAAAEAYGYLRAALERQGATIGPNDLLIAAVALSRDLTLVTHNTREFGRVPGRRLEDWESGAGPSMESQT